MLDESKYIEQFVIYIDLLGIKEFISEHETSNPKQVVALYESILGFAEFRHLNQAIDGITFNFEELLSPHYTVSVLSDSIIITLPADKVELLPFLIRMICISQLNFMMKEVPLRGYIALGKCYHDNEKGVIFGGGLIKAYQKERDSVKYPRVIVDDKVLYRLNKIYNKPISSRDILVERYKKTYPSIEHLVPFFNLGKNAFVIHIGKDPLDGAVITRFNVAGLIRPHYNALKSKDGLSLDDLLQFKVDLFRERYKKTRDKKDESIYEKWNYLQQYFQVEIELVEQH